jgi:hypothetical protein
MEKLRDTIDKYSRWKGLDIYIERMEGHLESDFSISVENAKALLESIGKEICDAKGVELGSSPSINAVLKKSFVAIGYTSDDLVTQISSSLATIGQFLGNLRNEISPTSHGKSLEELRERNNKVDLLTREFLIDSTLIVAVFLIRAFEERKIFSNSISSKLGNEEALNYEGLDDFNSEWDDIYGEFQMGNYSYAASEILFNVDYNAYVSEYRAYKEADSEDLEESNDAID